MTNLKDWLAARDMTVVEFADELGLDMSGLYRAIAGDRLPSLETACAIEYFTAGEVRPESFLRKSPDDYIKQWRKNAKKSVNPVRRKRAYALSRRERETQAADQTEAA